MELGQVTDATKNEWKIEFNNGNENKLLIIILMFVGNKELLTYFQNFNIYEKIKSTKMKMSDVL